MTLLQDHPARHRVHNDTAALLFVEAGAGTGKTHALVQRLSALLLTDRVPVDQIAAITFTEKAAAELRDRLRMHLVSERDKGDTLADVALAGLDTAAIGTLHSFALRLLSENPLEAGIPPRVTAQQDTAEATAVNALWQECATVLFGTDHEGSRAGNLARAVDDMLDAGVGTLAFRDMVEALHRDWDRLPTEPLYSGGSPNGELPTSPDLAEVAAAVGSIVAWRDSCQDETDLLYATIGEHEEWLANLHAAATDPTASPSWVELLAKPVKTGRGGKGANWGGADAVKGIKEEIKALEPLCKEVLATHWRPRIAIVLDALIPVVLRHADDRRRHGTLQFHDQLVLARELLQNRSVRDRVRVQYTRILIDEFQDTDPIQLDLATLLTSDESGDGPESGRLFTVGDPKQSIYRFRRADISTYLRAQSGNGVEVERLSTNFRCSRAVLDWVNSVFSEVLLAAEGVQPAYQDLEPGPGRPVHDSAHGPRPFVFRTEDVPDHCPRHATEDDKRHWTEASDVARVIATAIREEWTHESKNGEQTPLRLGDIAILLPSRGSLPMIEKCLDHAGIDFRTEASSIVYGTPEIRDLLLAVRAVANTADEASLVGALRSPLFGCGDDDLLRWRSAGGTWASGAPAPEGLSDSPVAEGIRYLSALGRGTRRPGELLETLVHDRMVFESVAESPRRRDLWRRIRFVTEHAWQWEESAADPARADLREYADWALSLTAEDARVPEAAIPEIGVDAVRITTIHASKGLEYPMVVIAGMSRKWPADRERLLWTDDEQPRPAASFSPKVRDPRFNRAAEREAEHSLAERIRLLYVATTRAESRLAVSGHGYVLTKATKPQPKKLWGSLLGSVMEEPDSPPLVPYGEDLLRPADAPDVDVPDEHDWLDRSEAISARSAERAGWSATRIVHPAAAAAGDSAAALDTSEATESEPAEERPPLPEQLAAALRDRFAPAPARQEEVPPAPRRVPLASGPDVGTAVHHLAEHTDLAVLASADGRSATGDDSTAAADWERWAAGQLTALGLSGGLRSTRTPEAVAEMVAVARTALTSEPVRRAAARPHWAELPVAGPLSTADGRVVAVDGVVDLVVDEPDGSLSIVDYKTDVSVTTTTIDEYLLQLCAYAELLGATTGRRVSRIELVFCRGGRATVVGRDLG
ncbi:UvrD-helicase domain-containing protein [Rhodococcus sp. IEGM 1408]|uniref:UvrD-helicase domain-containing protein n=1 Tax=Rhodococcus sp. IEGM 1408 TaxID=3082220 RepID=UPI002953F34B|nr:UvrD-helicase domain-containing protein [Rhodococcus sp. IEGM 1408]MDV8001956.1 UvrD-helicase domain-containing protein [Rhodococcus sp. IEGM 1408]